MDKLKRATAIQIREARKERGMQQLTLAEVVGVSRTSISNIEKGKQALSLSLFCKIANALDYQPDQFLNRIINRKPDLSVSKSDVDDEVVRRQIAKVIQQ